MDSSCILRLLKSFTFDKAPLLMPNNSQYLVNFFREAPHYIHMHRGKTFVIAISGEALLHPNAHTMLSDIAVLSTLGARIVLIHGARPQIDEQLAINNHHTSMHNGLRVTDKKAIDISKTAIGATRLDIENTLNQSLNRPPPIVNSSLGILSGNFLTAKPMGVIDGIDYMC